jgi:hypothetical protein
MCSTTTSQTISHPTFTGLLKDQPTFTVDGKTYDRIASTKEMLKSDFRARVNYALENPKEYIIIDQMRLCGCCGGLKSNTQMADMMILNDDQLRPNNENEIDWDSFIQREASRGANISLETIGLNETETRQCLLLILPNGADEEEVAKWFGECCGGS